MPTQRTIITKWDGGISNNSKSGLVNSCRMSRFLNIYDDGDSVTLNPIGVKESGSVVTGLVQWMVDAQPFTTDRYAYDNAGNIYKITSGTWTLDRAVSGGGGQGMEVSEDFLYYATSTGLGKKGNLSGSNGYVSDDFVNNSTLNLDLNGSANTGNTYTPPVAISEAAADTNNFIPNTDPLLRIDVKVTTKGTGSLTVTVHDSDNHSLGAVTLANGSVTAAAYNTFTFSPAIRVTPLLAMYHFHVTSSVADSTIDVTTSSSLAGGVNYKSYFQTLVADTSWHPIMRFNNGLSPAIAIGNERYVATWDGVTYSPNKIELESGFKVRALARYQEFIVIAAWRGTAIDNTEQGRMYYWDGVLPSANYYDEITTGLPNAIVNSKNRLFSVLGSAGDMFLGNAPYRAIQPLPRLGVGKKIEVAPGAITNWRRRVQIGAALSTDDSNFEQGVYEFGNQSDRAISYTAVSTEVLNYGFGISTGNTKATTTQIGCVHAFGKDLYIAWADNGTYGVDKVTKTNNPSATGSWESLIMDDTADASGQLVSAPSKTKSAVKLVITYATLPTGCTVAPKYKIDRATNFTIGTAGIAGSNRIEQVIMQPFKEIEIGFDLTATVNYPTITGVYFEFDPRVEENTWST